MVNYARDRGTRAETAVADYLTGVLGVECMRRTQQGGGNDRGDIRITGIPLMTEIKNTKTVRLSKWADEVSRQCVNCVVPYGVLIWSPPGMGPKSIERWVAFEWAETCVGPWKQRGSQYAGPLTRFAAVAADYWANHDDTLYIASKDAEFDTFTRARTLGAWAVSVQEELAGNRL